MTDSNYGNENLTDNRITITDVLGSHIDEICRIERESFVMPWSRKMFEDILYEIEHEARNQEEEHYKFFVAEDAEGHVAGYAVLNRAVGEGQLLDIAVRKASRGKGIGDMLMSALVGYHRDKGDKLLMLEVRKSNTAAKSLYEKYGFAESGTRKNYYTHPTEDAVLMDLRLEK